MAAALVREAVATPAQLRWLAAHEPHLFPCLLDSPSGGPLGRHALLLARTADELVLWGDGRLHACGAVPAGDTFAARLDAWWCAGQGAPGAEGLPFAGGWFTYFAYEYAAQLEPRLALPPLPAGEVLAWAVRAPAAIVLAEGGAGAWLVAEAGDGRLLEAMQQALARAAAAVGEGAGATAAATPLAVAQLAEDDPARFISAVVRAQEHIGAGDIYQANLSRAWRVQLAQAPDVADLYARLAGANPAPFAALASLPDGTRLLGSSPERLVRVRDGRIETRPIAGTRARLARGELEQPERDALLAHPKERAEHVMLIDLERNDLGRVCEPGSVMVDEFMVTETYRHVHHIVSNVCGRLRTGTTPGEVLRAVFPGGTITGCPKLRAIDVIAALEQAARGPYTGSLGYLGRDGSMDLNILIRTASLRGSELALRAGAGIVADSDPARELAETRAKARGLLRAFGAGALA